MGYTGTTTGTIAAALALALAGAALAQDAANFDGKWHGSFTDRQGRTRQAELLVSGQSGSWTYAREGGKWDNGCFGPELPIVVLSATGDTLKLRIDGEKVLKGCGERVVTLTSGPEGLMGKFADNGHEVKFTRK